MLQPGSHAPEFILQDQAGRDRSLSGLLLEGPLILYFYPADFTPGCTREACAIRDMHGEIRDAGLAVAGVSPQDPVSHARFRYAHDLPFILLADPDKVVIRMYDVDGPLGIGVRRATYLIDPNRRIVDAVLADFRISRHQAFMTNVIRRLSIPGIAV